ncbi:MAG: DUF3472 domain-containing protein [Clostridia bacterium]|nr:DUF3472 domain-containing protein [Clostridia bacterium]
MRFHRLFVCLSLVLLGGLCALLPAKSALAQSEFECSAEIAVYSISQERYLRSCGEIAELSQIGADEYFTFVLTRTYNGSQTKRVENFYVRVDDGPKWSWIANDIQPGQRSSAHIYYSNMQNLMKPGTHKVVWYVNDTPILTKSFTLTQGDNWYSRFSMPSADEIKNANQTATVRSPYLYGWLTMDNNFRYTEISVDFKADYVPKATYCALANLRLDLSGLKKKYKNVHSEYESVNLYAGFQRRWNETITIMSAWDIYYTDKNGVEHTLRPKQIYPDKTYIGDGTFGGEGTGMQMLMPYDWEVGHWYRMLLQCGQSDSGTTTVEQWVCDLETGEWTLMCKCDTGLPDSCFIGSNAFFLENFDPKYAGEIRAMEVTNARVRDTKGNWRALTSAYIGCNGGLPNYNGSYAYGADDTSFFMITSGAGGDWYGTSRVPKNNKTYNLKYGASTCPY